MKNTVIIIVLLIIAALLINASLYAEELADKPDTSIEAGQAIFQTYCADACHQAPDRGRLNSKQWRIVLKTMQTRMKSSGRTPLTEAQSAQLLEYLSQEK